MNISDGEPLTINRADCDSPVVGIHSSKLWNVRGDFAVGVALALPVNLFDVLGKTEKVGNNKLMTESACDQDNVGLDDAVVGKIFSTLCLHFFNPKTHALNVA